MSEPLHLFEHYRPFLRHFAINLAGNRTDAEDLLNETYIRWHKVDIHSVKNPRAMLATILARLASNQKTSARARREVVVDPQTTAELQDYITPELSEVSDALQHAFELVLTRMAPNERMVFLLREIFEWEYSEIATVLNTSEMNCRQLLRRAKEHLRSGEQHHVAARQKTEQVLEDFLHACKTGEVNKLIRHLNSDAILVRDPEDAGMPKPALIRDAAEVARTLSGIFPALKSCSAEMHVLSPSKALFVFRTNDGLKSVLAAELDQDGLRRIDQVSCPTRLQMFSKILTSELSQDECVQSYY